MYVRFKLGSYIHVSNMLKCLNVIYYGCYTWPLVDSSLHFLELRISSIASVPLIIDYRPSQ